MYDGFSTEFGFNWLNGKATRFFATVATSFTYRFVYVRSHCGFRDLASFTVTTKFCGTGLVIDEHCASGDVSQYPLSFIKAISVPNFRTFSEVCFGSIFFCVMGENHDL